MKLSSLIERIITNLKRIKKKKNNYLLLGATILAFGGFFYSQTIFAKSIAPLSKDFICKTHSTTFENEQKKLSPEEKLSQLNKTAESTPKKSALKAFKPTSESKQSKLPIDLKLSQLDENLKIEIPSSKNDKDTLLKDEIARILIDTPMEKMIEPISKQDKVVAAFLVGIALKESGFGKHVPVLNGQDCYNYWGYRGKRTRMGTGGHTCFDSPEDAVATVGKRIHTLAIKQKRNTPQKMLIWKCGTDCGATGGWPAAHKWAKDVSVYFNKINNS